MKRSMCAVAVISVAGLIFGLGEAMAQAPVPASKGAGKADARASAPPRESTRVTWQMRKTVGDERLLSWRLGVSTDAFRPLAFAEALAKIDALGVPYVEGSSTQLNSNLSPDELAAATNRLRAFSLRMVAYRVESLGADDAARRKVFAFAKAMGVEMIVSSPDPAALADIDKLANEFSINFAIQNRGRKETPAYWNPKGMLTVLEGRSKRIGVYADLGSWMQEGVKPVDGLSQIKDRLMGANLRDRSAMGAGGRDVATGSGAAGMTAFFNEVYRLGLKPLFFTVGTTGAGDASADLSRSVEGFEKAVQPSLGDFVTKASAGMKIRGPEELSADVKQKIEAAIPQQAPAKPKKPRKLLVMDLCVDNMSHNTIPHFNYALELMGKKTGAFEAIFDNDENNLKYPKIKQYDAIFLNDTVGELFPDPAVRAGLLRFVREGGGIGGLHGATYASRNWPEFMEMIGAGDGPHRVQPGVWKFDDPNSPLTKMFGGKPFSYIDEYYRYYDSGLSNWYSRDKVHVLYSIDMERSPDFNQGRPPYIRKDNDYAIAWIKSYGKGRVYNCSLGHMVDLCMQPQINEHFLAAMQFLLGDLPADTTPSAKLAARK